MMTANKHTPGPWKDDSLKFSAGWRCIVKLPDGRSIDVADPRNRTTDDEDKANAELIASAPELVKKVEQLTRLIFDIAMEFAIHSCPKSGAFCWLCAAAERVEKVRGESEKRNAVGQVDKELEAVVGSLKSLYLSTLANLDDTMKHDFMNGQRDQDRLARARGLLIDLEKKYNLPHWEYLDHKF